MSTQEAGRDPRAKSYLRLEDGTLWPNPARVAEIFRGLCWANNSTTITSSERAYLSSICSAYIALCDESRMGKKLPMIRRAGAALNRDPQ